MKSVWNDSQKPDFPTLEGDDRTDVLIIGGGMCGILCAYMLKEAGVDCILVEADEICHGVTNGTTAKITLQHGLIYDKIIRRYGFDKAQIYYKSQLVALNKLKSLAERADSDYESCSNVVYARDNAEKIERELHAMDRLGCLAEFTKDTELPFEIEGAVRMYDQARFHPLKFAYAIADGMKIYEHTKVLGLKPHMAVTGRGRIAAEKIIVATHFPFVNKHGVYFMKMYQHRSYVLALGNAPRMNDMYIDEAMGGFSFRMHDNLLLLGGSSHRTGSKSRGWGELECLAGEYYPSSHAVSRWATQDCMTLDSIPYIGRYSEAVADLYVATGFNKWGMTSSMLSAIILTDMVRGRENEYEEVYSPSRSMLHPQLVLNIFETAKSFLTPTVPRCPHMGCALKYNKFEHSWDCPCHGSRFEENGRLIDNPSTDDKRLS